MAETGDTTTPDPSAPDPTPGDPAATPGADQKDTTDWKAMARKHEREAKAARDQLKAIEDRDKTETQKAVDRATAAEQRAAEAEKAALRNAVGIDKRLPKEIVELLKGDTEEEMAAHADRLSELVKQAVRPRGDVDQGRRGDPPANTPRDQFAEFMKRQLNPSG